MKYTIGYKMSKKATNPLSNHLQMQEKIITEAMAKEMYSHPSFVMFMVYSFSYMYGATFIKKCFTLPTTWQSMVYTL